MSKVALSVANLSKQYRLGLTHAGSLSEVASRWTRRLRGLPPIEASVDAASGTSLATKNGDFWALRDVSFEVRPGEVVGVIGRNGAGKSTLLKILSRVTVPTIGEVRVRGRVGSLLEVGTGFHPELTGRENVYMNATLLGMSKREVRAKLDEIVDFAGVERFLDTPVKRYSSGMKVRLGFAVAAHLEPEVLIVDEVLAVGDAEFQKKCLGKMKDVAGEGRTVVFVSHNMGAVRSLCERGIVLSGGSVLFEGGAAEAVEKYFGDGPDRRPTAPHVLYRSPGPAGEPVPDYRIEEILLLGVDGRPKSILRSGEDVVLKVRYSCQKAVPHGSVYLQVYSPDGFCLMTLSTLPGGGLPVAMPVGSGEVGCRIESLPLAGGRFPVSAGLAIPNVVSLCHVERAGDLVVVGTDRYGTGYTQSWPTSAVFAADWWSVPRTEESRSEDTVAGGISA
ncbi:ABC transporter ATP-binding protein [Alienimonas sp. DA493]|uniref:ABC transporter ATP-binding protein n=1 Tax=Alienimonas sp. DA493 TaxID=3373605 RepID=UPI0037551D82